ncbi:MAG: glycoside hydrolase family 43 protein [Microthrixaceae bacterium]
MSAPPAGPRGRSQWPVLLVACALTVGMLALPATPIAAADPTYEPYTYLDLRDSDGNPALVADPSVIKVGSTWYLYPTHDVGRGFEVWTSDDLKSWTNRGFVWTPTPGSWNDEGKFWAPEIIEINGEYWMYYTANERIGVAKASSPLGPFVDALDHPLMGAGYGGVGDGNYTDPPGLLANNEEKAIDAFVLETSSGELFFYATNYNPIAEIVVMPMDDPVTLRGKPTTALGVDTSGWEVFVREAPVVFERNGIVHLMYSGQGAESPCYSVGDATSTSPLGPFTRRVDNPILRQSPDDGFFGPGHHGVVEGANGDLLAFFHTKLSDEFSYDRRIRYAPMLFDSAGDVTFDPAPPGADVPVQPNCVLGGGSSAPTTTTTSATTLQPASPSSGNNAPSSADDAPGPTMVSNQPLAPRFTG